MSELTSPQHRGPVALSGGAALVAPPYIMSGSSAAFGARLPSKLKRCGRGVDVVATDPGEVMENESHEQSRRRLEELDRERAELQRQLKASEPLDRSTPPPSPPSGHAQTPPATWSARDAATDGHRIDGPSPVAPAGSEAAPKSISQLGAWGFGLGIAGYLLSEVGIIPIAAIVVSLIALSRFDEGTETARWMPIVGALSGAAGLLLYLEAYGHIG